MPDMSLVFGDPSSTCSLADIECMESDRVEVCIWPDYLGEQPADVVCELGGCDTISGCMLDYPRSCTDDQISADCFSCVRRVNQEEFSDLGMVINCMAPAVPLVEVCPDGTTLAPDAVTPTIGECRHECHSDDAWNQDHACFPLISSGQFDWNNNTCGVGTCDMHSTPAACEANSGFWREDELFSEQTCSDIQMVGSYISFADNSAAMFTAMMVSMAGPTCCTGFDADAYFTCTDSDMSIFVRLATGHPRRCLPHCCLHAKAAALSFAKQG